MVSAGSSDQAVHIWDEPSTQELYFLPGHTGSVNEVRGVVGNFIVLYRPLPVDPLPCLLVDKGCRVEVCFLVRQSMNLAVVLPTLLKCPWFGKAAVCSTVRGLECCLFHIVRERLNCGAEQAKVRHVHVKEDVARKNHRRLKAQLLNALLRNSSCVALTQETLFAQSMRLACSAPNCQGKHRLFSAGFIRPRLISFHRWRSIQPSLSLAPVVQTRTFT